jgi:very-short-patch-repair endonuclease
VRLRRRRELGPSLEVGVPRTRPEAAAVRAAQWAKSDRQAALIICLVVQQRLVRPERLLDQWLAQTRSPRRVFLHAVIRDVCDGVHSLGELDFARLCRARGLPEPSRQAVRVQRDGRAYLDVAWDDVGLVIEIDGGHHGLALNPLDDALRQNEVVLSASRVLRIPVIGLRLDADAFMDQVVRAHHGLSGQAA